jgi:hypothetical protein
MTPVIAPGPAEFDVDVAGLSSGLVSIHGMRSSGQCAVSRWQLVPKGRRRGSGCDMAAL